VALEQIFLKITFDFLLVTTMPSMFHPRVEGHFSQAADLRKGQSPVDLSIPELGTESQWKSSQTFFT
jgi:hypothetical protein